MESGSPQQRIRHGYYPCDDQEQRQKTRVGAGAEVHADAREKYEGQPDEHHKAKKFQYPFKTNGVVLLRYRGVHRPRALSIVTVRYCQWTSSSSIASTTKCMRAMSCVTQYSFRRRCSSFGMRVANCVHTSSVFAIYAASFFDPGGRPGPRRHTPMRLLRRGALLF